MVITESPQEIARPDLGRRIPVLLWVLVAGSTFLGIGFLTESGIAEQAALPPEANPPEILETWMDAYNSGELDSLLAMYTTDAVINGTLLQLDEEHIRAVHSLNMSWEESFSLSRCGEVDVGVIRCDYLRSNAMLTRAGVTGSGVIEFGLDLSGSIRRSDLIVVNPELPEFEAGLSNWIEKEYPEVDLATRFGEMLIVETPTYILALVDEFVEQSEIYPLSG